VKDWSPIYESCAMNDFPGSDLQHNLKREVSFYAGQGSGI